MGIERSTDHNYYKLYNRVFFYEDDYSNNPLKGLIWSHFYFFTENGKFVIKVF